MRKNVALGGGKGENQTRFFVYTKATIFRIVRIEATDIETPTIIACNRAIESDILLREVAPQRRTVGFELNENHFASKFSFANKKKVSQPQSSCNIFFYSTSSM